MENKYLLFGLIFVISVIVSLVFLKRFIRFSVQKNLIDIPDDRKKHALPTPTSGGIVFGLLAVLLLPVIFLNTAYGPAVCAAILLLVVGFFDDRHDFSAKLKFGFQIIAAITVLTTADPIAIFGEDQLILNQITTFLFIIGFTNSFNLIDGVDGLAGSYAAIVLVVLAAILIANQNYYLALLAISLVGGIVGFLRYNLNPAKIFMGDTGSLFLGFLMSFFTIVALNTSGSSTLSLIPNDHLQLFFLSALALPMLDTIRVMGGRILKKKSPFKADRSHLHHVLGKIGLKPSGVSFFFLGTTFGFMVISLTLVQLQYEFLFVILTLVSFSTVLFNVIIFIRMQQHKRRIQNYQSTLDYMVRHNQLMTRESLRTVRK